MFASFLLSILIGIEWTEYETSMPDWHHGGKYDYQIANMQDKDLRGVIPELVRWLDHESEMSGKEEEEGGEANEDSNGEEVKGILTYLILRPD